MSAADEKLASLCSLPAHPNANTTVLVGDATDATSVLLKRNECSRTPEAEAEPLWYLAYGSNLNSSVFKARRGIRPLEERHVLVEGLELTFNLSGLPYFEPRFANCRFASATVTDPGLGGDEKGERRGENWDLNAPWTGKGALIGVAYLVMPEDFARIVATEGGGTGYKMVAVEGQVFAAETKSSSSLKHRPGEPHFEFTGERVRAFTLLASCEKTRQRAGQPSARYLKLIRDGAGEHALPPSYIAYLASLKPFVLTIMRQKAGGALFLTLWALPMLTTLLLGLILAKQDGTYPKWVIAMNKRVDVGMWKCHDGFFQRWFGDGERTVGTHGCDVTY